MQIQMNLPRLEVHRIEEQFENKPHAHEQQFQVTVPLRGTCYFRQENSERILTAGRSLVLQPNDKHSLHIAPGAAIAILIVDEQSLRPPQWTEGQELPLWHQFDPGIVAERFLGWLDRAVPGDPVEQLDAEEIETSLLSDLHRLLWGSGAADYRKEASSRTYFARVLEYIHAHYTESLSIDTLASIALQSRYHFMRSFKAGFGLTPYQYVLQLRVEKARDCLLRTEETITSLSYRLGFSSTSQFYRAFLKFAGVTPEQFRAAAR